MASQGVIANITSIDVGTLRRPVGRGCLLSRHPSQPITQGFCSQKSSRELGLLPFLAANEDTSAAIRA